MKLLAGIVLGRRSSGCVRMCRVGGGGRGEGGGVRGREGEGVYVKCVLWIFGR